MDWAAQWGWNVLNACLQLLTQPFYYISIIVVALGYRRQMLLERKLFHTRLHGWWPQTWRTVLTGLVAGLLISAVGLFVGAHLTAGTVISLWACTGLLMLLRVRYLCFAYAAGLLGVVQFVLSLADSWQPEGWVGDAVAVVRGLDMPALLLLVAVLHMAEALLLLWKRGMAATPMYFEGKRGRMVGGYRMEDYWPVPLLLLIPVQNGFSLPWPTLFGDQAGYMLAALPVIIGFSGLTTGRLPGHKAAQSARRLFLYSLVLLVLSLLAAWWNPLIIAAALFSFLAHEVLVWFDSYEENQISPLYVHPEEGLRVLAVLPGSPADELGITAGEAVYKVNGMLIRSREELHQALRVNAAFCKLEIRNHQGESKFMQRGLYEGEHHQLGMVLAPDTDVDWSVPTRQASIYQVITMRTGARRRKAAEPVPRLQGRVQKPLDM
ncbi:PDZ domain-containing protein [Paenibacillus sp. P96]|uniref:PDZ domain-containing protein n=1 Tax=Paenibacillus zeirhizosphaerae TaxID=2987519 RepID=A0ABT9FP37_9BACL|nr:PDZ domain-containing protein [Paenibacillus sp. P96]MDP4096493.1 PDZ domain-containing protein [Paenibacillus sp. P96]